MKYKILKVKDWLKFKNPDIHGFKEHVAAWKKDGIPFGVNALRLLAKNYGVHDISDVITALGIKKIQIKK